MSSCDYNLFVKVKELQEMNLSVLQGDQYGMSKKMDTLLVYYAF